MTLFTGEMMVQILKLWMLEQVLSGFYQIYVVKCFCRNFRVPGRSKSKKSYTLESRSIYNCYHIANKVRYLGFGLLLNKDMLTRSQAANYVYCIYRSGGQVVSISISSRDMTQGESVKTYLI